MLPYPWSYVVWVAIGDGLAGGWIHACFGRAARKMAGGELGDGDAGVAVVAPLLLEGWVGGRPTALVFLRGRGTCICVDGIAPGGWRASCWPCAGVQADSYCVLLMLVVTRSFRVLLGMALGGLGFAAVPRSGRRAGKGLRAVRANILVKYAEATKICPGSVESRGNTSDLRSSLYPLSLSFVAVGAIWLCGFSFWPERRCCCGHVAFDGPANCLGHGLAWTPRA